VAVSAPPRPPEHDDLQQLADELRALIEEARRRARRRRLLYAAILVAAAAASALAFFGRGGGQRPTLGDSPADAAAPPTPRWTAGGGLEGGPVYAGAADPVHPGVVYLGTATTGVFKTTDGGRHWHAANAGMGSVRTDAVAVDPTHSSTVYAGTSVGVFKSTDAGRTWHSSTRGIALQRDPLYHRAMEGFVYALAVDPTEPGRVFAGTAWGGYRSDDAGRTWHEIAWLPNWAFVGEIRIAGDTVYMLARNGLWRSTDRGRRWARLATPWAAEHLAVGDRLWLATDRGLFTSVSGATWTRVPRVPRAFGQLAVDGSSVYLTSGRSIWATHDGTSWRAVHRGADWIFTLVATEGTVLAAGSGGVLRSADGGASWRLAVHGLAATSVAALATNGRGSLLAASSSVFRSADGRTWHSLLDLLGATTVGMTGSTYFAGTESRGLFVSETAGREWHRAPLPAKWIISLAADGDTVYAGTGRGLFVSRDRGAHWQPTPITSRVWALTTADGSAYAGTVSGGVWRSDDDGVTWTPATPHGSVLRSIAAGGDTVYAAAAKGLFVSDDRGSTWHTVPSKPPMVRAVAVGPTPTTVYVGTDFDGVYASADGGMTWRRSGPRVGVLALLFDGRTNTLYAATRGHGVLFVRAP
jgi:photosystem II stability/assembly factor-like uncharacterized protein